MEGVELHLELVREATSVAMEDIEAVKAARLGADEGAKLELDRKLCRLHEREADIASRLEGAQDGGITLELEALRHQMFMLETFVWLQLADGDPQTAERPPIEYVLEPELHPLQVQRARFLAGEAAELVEGGLPFAGNRVDRLTQQSILCYLLPPALAVKYGSYCSVPHSFQRYADAFREVDSLVASRGAEGLSPQHEEHLDAVLKNVLAAEISVSELGRSGGGAPAAVVPHAWKWRLLKDVDEVETAAQQALGAGPRESFGYRLWLMLHAGLSHATQADNLLELKLLIEHAGVANALSPLLRLRQSTTPDAVITQVVRVCAERRELPQLAALPLPEWLAAGIKTASARASG